MRGCSHRKKPPALGPVSLCPRRTLALSPENNNNVTGHFNFNSAERTTTPEAEQSFDSALVTTEEDTDLESDTNWMLIQTWSQNTVLHWESKEMNTTNFISLSCYVQVM